jgi:large repetitive protein
MAVAAVLAIPTTANADPVNHAPLALDQTVTVYQNTPYPVTLTGSDPDLNDAISYSVESGPNHGSLEGGVQALRKYTPVSGYSGPDVIKFRTIDSHGLASVAQGTITINVIPAVQANRPPAAVNQALSTSLNTPIAVKLTGSDPDLDPLQFLLNAPAPQHGTLTGSAPNLTYTPDTGFVGTDSFGFKVDDGKLQSPLGTITITVAKPNTPPVAKNISATTIQNRSVGITLGAYDADGDAVTFNTPSDPAHGTVTGTGANIVYTPDKWFHGIDSFTYTVTDGKATSAPATVTVVVRGFKHRPVAYDQEVATGVRQPVRIHLNGWTQDGDDLDFIIIDGPDHGRLIQNGDDVVYIPAKRFRGYDSFDFVVRDEDGNTSRPATVDIKVKSYWGGYYRH